MNLILVIVCMMAVWLMYTVTESYRSMQKELREIRLKCMGTEKSVYTKDPAKSMTTTLIEGLTKMRNATESI